MSLGSSVSQWLSTLKAGDLAAAERLWKRYAARLIELARRGLIHAPKGGGDEEDVAQSVFHNICRGAVAGRFENVTNRDDLWWLLLTITRQKVIDHVRREMAQKRGGGRVVTETDLGASSLEESGFTLEALVGDEPTAEFMAILNEETDRLMGVLRDDRLRQVAQLRIEGYTVSEIAANLGISTRSIERKLQLIRTSWTNSGLQ